MDTFNTQAVRTKKILTSFDNYFRQRTEEITSTALFLDKLNDTNEVNIAPNGKPYRTFSRSEMLEQLNLKRGSRQLDNVVKHLGLDPANSPYGGAWTVNLIECIKIKEAFNKRKPFERTDDQKLAVFTISNLKGGSCKTTVTTLAATGLAFESINHLRVGVIDADPQGTATRILLPKLKVDSDAAEYISLGDLIISSRAEFHNDDNEFSEYASNAFLETNYPNLKVLPAHLDDSHFELHSRMETMEDKDYKSYKPLQRIIEAVKDDFDVIFIDTPPALNEINIAAHFCASHLLIPLKASENDRDSTGKYVKALNKMYDMMMLLGHDGYSDIKFVPSAIDKRSATETSIELGYTVDLGSYITSPIPSNEAIKSTNEDLNTIFDISPSCYAGTKKTCTAAQLNVLPFIKSIESMLASYWKTGVHND